MSLTSTTKQIRKLSAATAPSSILKFISVKLYNSSTWLKKGPGYNTSQVITAKWINRIHRKTTRRMTEEVLIVVNGSK